MRVELLVQGMTCAACAAKVQSRLNAIENVATEKATVTAPLSVPVQLLVAEIERTGYGTEVAGAAMAASSVFVVANSVRLRRFGMPAAGRGLRPRPAVPVREEQPGDGKRN
ncbi:MAG TPA: heavy metal translocating P-type ATPase [Streptosporangiaceae bacterium]|jgi:cation transport ATPase